MGRKIVCYASDGNDYNRLEMSAWSVRKHLGDDVEIYLLTEHYWDPAVYNIKVINPVSALRNLNIFPYGWNRGGSFANLYRLVIPLLEEFSDVDRVLYLDTDTLVMSPEAKGLIFDSDLGTCELKMVPDVVGWREILPRLLDNGIDERTRSIMRPYFKEWNKYGEQYCNAGVSLFNLRQIRENGIDWYVRRLGLFWDIQLRGGFDKLDQDCINVFMNVDTSLDSRLDVIVETKENTPALIRHYASPQFKPLQAKDALKLGYYYCAPACRNLVSGECDLSDKRQLIVYLSHVVSDETIWRYRKLRDDVRHMGMDVLWWYHHQPDNKADMPDDIWYTDECGDDIFMVDEYNAPINSGQYSAAVYATMTIAEKYKDYDYIWVIEYDVCYSGNWADFFRRMNRQPHDFICERSYQRCADPGWLWWGLAYIPDKYRLWRRQFKSLVSIIRLSRRMLDTLAALYKDLKGKPHTYYENLWVMIAVNELTCLDIYPSECCPEYNFGVYSALDRIKPGKLYHAIKDNVAWENYAEDKNTQECEGVK